MFKFIVETANSACLTKPEFDSREEALAFGREIWSSIKTITLRTLIKDTDTGTVEAIWDKSASIKDVPEGHYAVDGKRYFVRHGSDRWEDWTFVSTGSDYHDRKHLVSVRPDGVVRGARKLQRLLHAIAADPEARAKEYGSITGRCAICSRKLENPESRAAGIGPVCAGKF